MPSETTRFDPNALDTGVLAVLASAAISLLAAGSVPGRLRIHWGSPHYGPEFAPAAAVLVGFPAAVAAGYLLARVAGWVLPVETTTARRAYAVAVLTTLGCLVATQALVLGLNLL